MAQWGQKHERVTFSLHFPWLSWPLMDLLQCLAPFTSVSHWMALSLSLIPSSHIEFIYFFNHFMIFPNPHAFALVLLHAWYVPFFSSSSFFFSSLPVTKFGSSLEQRQQEVPPPVWSLPRTHFKCTFLRVSINFKFHSIVAHIILHLVMCLFKVPGAKTLYIFSNIYRTAWYEFGWWLVFLFICLFICFVCFWYIKG